MFVALFSRHRMAILYAKVALSTTISTQTHTYGEGYGGHHTYLSMSDKEGDLSIRYVRRRIQMCMWEGIRVFIWNWGNCHGTV